LGLVTARNRRPRVLLKWVLGSSALQSFDEVVARIAEDNGHYSVNPAEDWRQGRTLFGGLTAALAYAACERMVADLPPLRAGQIAFIGPASGEVTMIPSVMRRGKSVTFMGCDVMAEGALAARAIFTFGAARHSPLCATAPRSPAVASPDDCAPLFGKFKPAFTVHLDQRFAGGARPASGADKGDLMIWVRHEGQTKASMAALIALGDALPPASLPRAASPIIISTMTWAFDLVEPERPVGAGWYLIRSTDDAVADGYAGQMMGIWNEAGDPVMIARQCVAIFA
jgi:acyl-CoA thioesterase